MIDKFTIAGGQLTGHGLAFDVTTFLSAKDTTPEINSRLIEVVETIYLQGRESNKLSFDDRFDLSCAVEVLRALSVIVGPFPGERHRRAADAISRLLQE